MYRVEFRSAVLGIPQGPDRPTVSYDAGTVADVSEEIYHLLRWRTSRDGTPWIIDATGEALHTPTPRRKPKPKPEPTPEPEPVGVRVVDPLPFPCEICTTRFATEEKLRRHRAWHTRKKEAPPQTAILHGGDRRIRLDRTPPGKYACTQCDRSFSTMQGLRCHEGHEHPEWRAAQDRVERTCAGCGQFFKSRSGFSYHRSRCEKLAEQRRKGLKVI